MARRAITSRKPKKAVRRTKTETYLVNLKYLGDEPTIINTQLDYIKALNWYNTFCSKDDAREYLNTYLQSSKSSIKIKSINGVPDNKIVNTAGWVARMINRGISVPESAKVFLDNHISSLSKRLTKPKKSKVNNENVVSIQDKIKEKSDAIIADIEELIDQRDSNNNNFSFYNWLKSKEIPAMYGQKIIERYIGLLQELIEASEGKDKQLKEAYSCYTKKQLNSYMMFINMIIEDSEKYSKNINKVRKPRKKKVITADKKLKTFKYQKEDNNLKIVSENPEKIIGAKELWTYNTKYKTLSVFRAMNHDGLDVKGSSIINYDSDTSMTKRTGRKAEYYVDRVIKGGKIVLRKLMDEDGIGASVNLANRINDNTILLKILA